MKFYLEFISKWIKRNDFGVLKRWNIVSYILIWIDLSVARNLKSFGIKSESNPNRSLKPHQPGKWLKTGQVAWLCGSHPLGCMITYLEKFFLFLNLSMLSLIGRRLLIPTVGGIHSIHSSEMSGRSCEGRVARCSCWTQCIRL